MSTDPIGHFIDSMTIDELKANARLAIVGNAWMNLDLEGIHDDHRDMADDALYAAESSAIAEDFGKFVDARQEAGEDYDVACKNWHRRLLNKVPIDNEGNEIVVDGFTWDEEEQA
jgi:hypothetical protein